MFGGVPVLHENLRHMAYDFVSAYSSDPNVLLKIRENRKASRPAWDVLVREFGAKRGRVVIGLLAKGKAKQDTSGFVVDAADAIAVA